MGDLEQQATLPALSEDAPSRRVWIKRATVAVATLFVFLFSVWDSWDELHRSGFHPDESRWINRAYYLRETLNPLSDVWSDRYLIRGQPPMGSYVIGASLLAQGRDLDTNGPWDFQFGFESNVTWNVTRGDMPANDDVIAARRANIVIGAVTCAALFLIVSQITNVVGGLAAGIFMAVNPLHQYLATLSTSDTVFTCFIALSVLAAMWLVRGPTWWRSMLFALAMGAGASTKLSPLALAVGIGLFGIVVALDPWLRHLPSVGSIWRWISRRETGTESRLGWMLIVQPVVVAALFVLSYPYLWSAPVERTRILFDFRREEMASQARVWPGAAINNRFDAIDRTWRNLNDVYSSIDHIIASIGARFGQEWDGIQIDMYLVIAGLVALVVLSWRSGIASPTTLGFITIAGQTALILGAIGVDFNRYYLPLLLTAAVGMGTFAGELVELVLWAVRRRRPAEPSLGEESAFLPLKASEESASMYRIAQE